MALFLDSANIEDIRQVAALGFVTGITTNPALLAKETSEPLAHIEQISRIFPGFICYQLMELEREAMLREGRQAHSIAPGRIALKIPCTLTGLAVAANFNNQIPCAITAVYSAQQGWLSAQAGSRYVIPYINRTHRMGGNPLELVRQLAAVIGSKTEILAASVKTPQEALATLEAGAQHLAVPLDLIKTMAEHEWSRQAIDEFARIVDEKKAQIPGTPVSPASNQPEAAFTSTPAGSVSESVEAHVNYAPFNHVPFTMLDYIVGKIKLEELLADVKEEELRSYLAQRELDKLKEEEEIDARLAELKKKLDK